MTRKAQGSNLDAEGSAETAKNQAKTDPSRPAEGYILKLEEWAAKVNERMDLKERWKLVYIDQQIPRPYFERFRKESNALFFQLVRINSRLRKAKRGNIGRKHVEKLF
jgi:hypothetical protein